MTTSYPEFPLREISVNWDSLSRSCTSFYRWLYRWHKQTGDVSPSTRYFARKQGKTTRTVYRWLADLEAAGLIIRQVEEGVERSIIPLVAPPKREKCHRSCHPKCHRSIPYDADTQETQQQPTEARASEAPQGDSAMCVSQETECRVDRSQSSRPYSATPEAPKQESINPLAEDLTKNGVALPIALHLAATVPDLAAEQLAALPYRQARDRAAVLVASIKQSWPIPEAFKQALARKQKEAADAQNRAMRAELAKRRQITRKSVSASFSGLPEQVRDELLDRAAAALRSELPAAWKMMQNRPPEVRAAWLTGRAIALMESGS